MKLYIIHYYDDSQYEERLEVRAVCTYNDKAPEICNQLNEDYTFARYSYVGIDADELFEGSILTR